MLQAMLQDKKLSGSTSCLPWELLFRHVVQAEQLTDPQRERVVEHIACCEHCANTYEALGEAHAELWDQAVAVAGLPLGQLPCACSVEEALIQLWQRVAEDEARQRQYDRRTVIRRIGKIAAATAACLLLAANGDTVAGTHKDCR
jgi:hypothetical protein